MPPYVDMAKEDDAASRKVQTRPKRRTERAARPDSEKGVYRNARHYY